MSSRKETKLPIWLINKCEISQKVINSYSHKIKKNHYHGFGWTLKLKDLSRVVFFCIFLESLSEWILIDKTINLIKNPFKKQKSHQVEWD